MTTYDGRSANFGKGTVKNKETFFVNQHIHQNLVESRYKVHRDRVLNAKSGTSTYFTPERIKFMEDNKTKKLQTTLNSDVIRKENEIMFSRLKKLKKTPGPLRQVKPVANAKEHMLRLSRIRRENERKRIRAQNEIQFKHFKNPKHVYSKAFFRKARRDHNEWSKMFHMDHTVGHNLSLPKPRLSSSPSSCNRLTSPSRTASSTTEDRKDEEQERKGEEQERASSSSPSGWIDNPYGLYQIQGEEKQDRISSTRYKSPPKTADLLVFTDDEEHGEKKEKKKRNAKKKKGKRKKRRKEILVVQRDSNTSLHASSKMNTDRERPSSLPPLQNKRKKSKKKKNASSFSSIHRDEQQNDLLHHPWVEDGFFAPSQEEGKEEREEEREQEHDSLPNSPLVPLEPATNNSQPATLVLAEKTVNLDYFNAHIKASIDPSGETNDKVCIQAIDMKDRVFCSRAFSVDTIFSEVEKFGVLLEEDVNALGLDNMHNLRSLLLNLFHEVDEDKNGYLSFDEFSHLMEKIDVGVSAHELRFVMSEADENENGMIDYNEFIPLAVDIIQSFRSRRKAKQGMKVEDHQLEEEVFRVLNRDELERTGRLLLAQCRIHDRSARGFIQPKELRILLKDPSFALSQVEANMLVQSLPRDASGKLKYTNILDHLYQVRISSIKNTMIEAKGSDMQRYIMDLLKGEEKNQMNEEGSLYGSTLTGKLPLRNIIQVLVKSPRLSLSRLQVMIIASEATIEDGLVDYSTFVPMCSRIIETLFDPSTLRKRAKLIESTDFSSESLLHGTTPEMLQKKLRTLFKSHDTDRSGYLDPEEFKSCLTSLDLALTESEIVALMATADSDGDGGVSFDEFAEFCTQNLMHLEREKLIRSLQYALDQDAKQKEKEEKERREQEKTRSLEQTEEEKREEKDAIDFLRRESTSSKRELVMTPPNSRMKSWSKHRIENHLQKLFESIDVEHKGFITKEQLKKVLEALGLTPFQFDLMISDIDSNEDGVISFGEFLPVARDLIVTFKAKNEVDEDQEKWEAWCEEHLDDLMRSSEVELEGALSTIDMLLLESKERLEMNERNNDYKYDAYEQYQRENKHQKDNKEDKEDDDDDENKSLDSLSLASRISDDHNGKHDIVPYSTFKRALEQTFLPKHEINYILRLVQEDHGTKQLRMEDVIDISSLRYWVYKARKLSLQRRLMETDLFSSAPTIVLNALKEEVVKRTNNYQKMLSTRSMDFLNEMNERISDDKAHKNEKEDLQKLPKHVVFECMINLASHFHLSKTNMIAIVSWTLDDISSFHEEESSRFDHASDSRSPSPMHINTMVSNDTEDGFSSSSSSSKMYTDYSFWNVESKEEFVDIVAFAHFAGYTIARMNKIDELFFRNFVLEKDTSSSLSPHELMGGLTLRGLTDYLSIELGGGDESVFRGWISKSRCTDILIHTPCLDLTQREIENILNTMKRKRWSEVEKAYEQDRMQELITGDSFFSSEDQEQEEILMYWADFIPRAYDIILNIKYQSRIERRKMIMKHDTKSEEQFQEEMHQLKTVVSKFIQLVKLMKPKRSPGNTPVSSPLLQHAKGRKGLNPANKKKEYLFELRIPSELQDDPKHAVMINMGLSDDVLSLDSSESNFSLGQQADKLKGKSISSSFLLSSPKPTGSSNQRKTSVSSIREQKRREEGIDQQLEKSHLLRRKRRGTGVQSGRNSFAVIDPNDKESEKIKLFECGKQVPIASKSLLRNRFSHDQDSRLRNARPTGETAFLLVRVFLSQANSIFSIYKRDEGNTENDEKKEIALTAPSFIISIEKPDSSFREDREVHIQVPTTALLDLSIAQEVASNILTDMHLLDRPSEGTRLLLPIEH